MLNNFILVGRVIETPTTTHTLRLAVTRTYKNIDGTYDTDFIEVQLPQHILENAASYLCKGDLVGVRGRIETTSDNNIKLIVDRLTYLSSTLTTTTTETTTTDNNMNKGEI